MQISKAIELLQKHGVTDDSATWQDYLDAVELGIEALERQRDKGMLTFAGMLEPLSGETTDD